MGRPMRDLAGQRFGRLVAMEPAGRKFGGNMYWRCRCDCGAVVDVRNSHLTASSTRRTVSCGCKTKDWCSELGKRGETHGMVGTPTYQAWASMIQRCTNPNHSDFHHYGGRGISVCEAWTGFAGFLADMGERPDGTSIDRIDVNGNYEPRNCRWATAKEQARNTRRNRHITHGGVTRTAVEWAERTGLPVKTIYSRILLGWTDEEIVTKPLQPRGTRRSSWRA